MPLGLLLARPRYGVSKRGERRCAAGLTPVLERAWQSWTLAAMRREALAAQLAERDRLRREASRLASLRGRSYESRAVGQ